MKKGGYEAVAGIIYGLQYVCGTRVKDFPSANLEITVIDGALVCFNFAVWW